MDFVETHAYVLLTFANSCIASAIAGQQAMLVKAAATAQLPVVITGAGIAGLSTAVALHKVTKQLALRSECFIAL